MDTLHLQRLVSLQISLYPSVPELGQILLEQLQETQGVK